MKVGQEHVIKKSRCCAIDHADRQAVLSLALARYNFSTPEIRVLMRSMLGHAISGRTIKRLAKTAGYPLKRGRPLTTPKIHKGAASELVEVTSFWLDGCAGNTLQLFDQVRGQFGLTPRQYLKWVAQIVRRGKYMMRRCLLCDRIFPSMESGERHCTDCRRDRRRLVKEERRYSFT